MITAHRIFLDLDGPLLDGKARHYQCYSTILERLGFAPIGIEEYWASKRSLVDRKTLLKASGAEAIYDQFLAAWLDLIETPEMLALDVVQEGAVACLQAWKEQRIEVVLVTMRKEVGALKQQLEATGLGRFLDAIIVCDHARGAAGKAHGARSFLRDGIDGARSIWIGDTEVDWEAARLLGCRAVLLANGLRSRAHLEALGGAAVMASILDLQARVRND